MIINIKLKLIDNTESWHHIDVENINDIELVWLFKRLNAVNMIEQQDKIIVTKPNLMGGRNTKAKIALYYSYGSNIVSVNEVNYNKINGKFSRGRKLNEMRI